MMACNRYIYHFSPFQQQYLQNYFSDFRKILLTDAWLDKEQFTITVGQMVAGSNPAEDM
jgi:hypothetical protein